eukprot:scaffold22088_cov114-Isochrysis_galbana.AAC.4
MAGVLASTAPIFNIVVSNVVRRDAGAGLLVEREVACALALPPFCHLAPVDGPRHRRLVDAVDRQHRLERGRRRGQLRVDRVVGVRLLPHAELILHVLHREHSVGGAWVIRAFRPPLGTIGFAPCRHHRRPLVLGCPLVGGAAAAGRAGRPR